MTDTAPITTPNVLDEALRLAALGLPVLPIRPGEKRPPMTAWQTHATTDPDIITNWYTGLYANCGVGVATGHDGLFVIDIDEHHPEASGSDTLQHLTNIHGPLPDTAEVQTGSGGRHIYLRAPYPIPNDAGRKLGPGIDIRGTGGQVLAPPTIHPNGRRYEWIIGSEPEDGIADAPDWLLQLLTPTPTITPTPERTHSIWDELDDSPAARYNQTTTWYELLTNDGWTLAHTDRNGEQHWTRPGKTSRDGTSATVGYNNQDVLVVFTSSLPWLPAGAYSRFGYYACRHHNGNRSAAARELRNDTTTILPTIVTTTTSTTDDWPEPTPLHNTPTVPPFPTHTLPTWITDHAHQIAHDLQVAIDLPLTLALGALSVAALGTTKVHYPRQRWTQPLNLYTATALPPSAGKSPAKNAIFHPLEQYEQQRLTQAAHQRLQNDTQRRILEKKQRNLEDRLAKAAHNSNDALTARTELNNTLDELVNINHTPSGRLLVDDTTTEALGVTLHEAGGSIAVVSAEGGLFDRIAGMYNDQIANLDLYLEAWSGGRYIVDRIKRDSIQIPSANLVIACTIQPATLQEIGARKQFAGRGLTARFLLSIPASNVGTRNRLQPTTGQQHTTNHYNQQLLALAEHLHTTPTTLTINPDASNTFAHWDQQLENRLAPTQDLEHLAEWIGKLRANTLRIAALLHLAHHQPGHQINDITMRQAIEIGDYYLAHMTAISDQWGINEDTAQAQKLLEWATHNNHTTFTIRDAMRANRRRWPNLDSITGPLTTLIEHGWIRPVDNKSVSMTPARGKPSPTLQVHPAAFRPTTGDNQGVGHVGHVTGKSDNQGVGHVGHVTGKTDPETAKQYEVVGHVGHVAIRGENTPPSFVSQEPSQPPTPGDMTDMTDNSNPLDDPLFDY